MSNSILNALLGDNAFRKSPKVWLAAEQLRHQPHAIPLASTRLQDYLAVSCPGVEVPRILLKDSLKDILGNGKAASYIKSVCSI